MAESEYDKFHAGELAGLRLATEKVCPEMCGKSSPVEPGGMQEEFWHKVFDDDGESFMLCPASPIHACIAEKEKA